MHALTLLLLVLVPAPRPAAIEPQTSAHPIVGLWDATWGESSWRVEFFANGTCEARSYGRGVWWTQGDLVFFTDSCGGWVIQITDWDELSGDGARSTKEGYTCFDSVKLNRR